MLFCLIFVDYWQFIKTCLTSKIHLNDIERNSTSLEGHEYVVSTSSKAEDTWSPIGYEENYFVIFFLYSWTKVIFLFLGTEELCYWWIPGQTPWKTELQYARALIIIFFLQICVLYSWTPKFVVLSFNMSFRQAQHLYPWTLKLSIPDLCQLVLTSCATHMMFDYLFLLSKKSTLSIICEMNLGTKSNALSLNRKY